MRESRRRSREREGLSKTEWARVRGALDAALDVSESKRRAWLAHELEDDADVLAQVVELLGEDDDGPLTATPLEQGLPGAGLRVGPWVTRRLLGAGGMGAVYLASRADGAFERMVALKVIRPELAAAGSTDVVARFRRERQLQAGLHHPGIARMLDGGATEEGAPFLVMEYVDGLSITTYSDEYRLTVRERVELFGLVVRAVAHAHEHRIVHRDIKPSNILVGTDGQPKLLDFGIAKGLDLETMPGEHDLTRGLLGFVTPAYASPEQIRGLRATARADLYSLGVLLYELLVHAPPLDFEGASAVEIERRSSAEQPLPPSAAIVDAPDADAIAERRCTSPRGLRSTIRGDLDRIALYCLRKEPQRRYASATALAEDLDRYLEGRPVVARPDTPGYRLLKFVTRHRLPVGLAALATAVLASGLALSVQQNRRLVRANAAIAEKTELASARLQLLRRLRGRTTAELKHVFEATPGALASSRELLEILSANLDEDARLAGVDLELALEMSETYRMLGALYYGGRTAHLGDAASAERLYGNALRALRPFLASDALNPNVALEVSRVSDGLAAIYVERGQVDRAVDRHERTLTAIEAFPRELRLAEFPLIEAESYVRDSLSGCELVRGRYERALAHATAGLELWEAALEKRPRALPFLGGQLSQMRIPMAMAHTRLGDAKLALCLLEEAEGPLREAQASHPGMSVATTLLVLLLRERSMALQAAGDASALDVAHEALRLAADASARAADDMRAAAEVVLTRLQLAELLAQRDELVHAEAEFRSALAECEAMDRAREPLPAAAARLGHAQLGLGEVLRRRGDVVGASELLHAAQGQFSDLSETCPSDAGIRTLLARSLLGLVELRADDGLGTERALEMLQRAESVLRIDRARGVGGVRRDALAGRAEVLRLRYASTANAPLGDLRD